MRVISWNVNGLTDRKKVRQVLRKLHSFKADVIVLQEIYKNNTRLSPTALESKVSEIEDYAKFFWKSDMIFHKAGRLAILSHYNKSLQLTNTFSNGRIIDFTFTHTAKGDRKIQIPYFTTNIRAIYAPAESGTAKSVFWTNFPPLPPLSWVIGDFNMAIHKDRSARTSSDNPGMVNDILEHHLDMQYLLQQRKPKPTYHHPSAKSKRSSRIDYIFAPDSALKPGAKFQLEAPGLISDHSILVLDNMDTIRKVAPNWRLNIKLLGNQMASDTITDLLKAPIAVHEWDDFKHKVKLLYQELGKKAQKKNIDSIQNLTRYLHNLRQRSASACRESEIERVTRQLAEKEEELAERLAIKSGTQWLEQGERSSSYFYQRFNQKLQTAHIPSLIDHTGNILTSPTDKAKACRDHLQDQWKETSVANAASFPWKCPTLSPIQANNIAKPISLEEVETAINQSPNNKAPGPDGIPSEFYKHFKSLLIPRLTTIFDEILQAGSNVPISWMQSKCVLIPKKTQGLNQLANWRPITLENCDLKIFSRILANRTQLVMDTLIGEQQTGFIAGRCIHHSVLSIETALHSGPKGSYMLSLDWSKAYDKVNHKWLIHCLNAFGFPAEYLRTIRLLFFNRNAEVSVEDSTEHLRC